MGFFGDLILPAGQTMVWGRTQPLTEIPEISPGDEGGRCVGLTPHHFVCRLSRNCGILNLTYLLTPWCRVLLEKLTGLHLVKKFSAFHGTRRYITALTSVRHLSVSWASPIQSIYPHPTYWRSVLILSTHLRLGLPIGLFPSGFPTKTLYTPSPHPCVPLAQPKTSYTLFKRLTAIPIGGNTLAVRVHMRSIIT